MLRAQVAVAQVRPASDHVWPQGLPMTSMVELEAGTEATVSSRMPFMMVWVCWGRRRRETGKLLNMNI